MRKRSGSVVARRISRQIARSLVLVCSAALGSSATLAWAEPSVPAASGVQTGSTWSVGQGDSWFSMRSRICPVESLQDANPGLSGRALRAGDRIQAPFVAVVELEKLQAQLGKAEQQRDQAELRSRTSQTEAQDATARLQAQVAELDAARAERDSLLASRSNAYLLQLGLVAAIVALAAGLAAALSAVYASRRGGHLRDQRLKEIEAQYTDLRRSVMDLDVQLQRRMLKLLSWHDTRVITQREVEEASAPVLDMARKLKERHAG